VSQTISSVTPRSSAAAESTFTFDVKIPRAWRATSSRTPFSQYQACSRVKMPLVPSMSQSTKSFKPGCACAAARLPRKVRRVAIMPGEYIM
jgi:hypothetical protein